MLVLSQAAGDEAGGATLLSLFHGPLERAAAQLIAGLDVKFLLDRLAMRFNRFRTQFELFGDLERAQAFSDQLENLEFAVGESADRLGIKRLAECRAVQQALGHLRTEIHFAAKDLANRFDNLRDRFSLVNKPEAAGAGLARRTSLHRAAE